MPSHQEPSLPILSPARTRWGWLPPVGVGVLLLIVFALGQLTPLSSSEWLRHYGVPVQMPLFSDLELVSWWNDQAAAGSSPYFEPIYNAQGQRLRMNYPPAFLGLSWLGLRAGNFSWWGVAWVWLFIVAFCFLARGNSRGAAVLWTLLLVSPATLFLFERGNPDILIFILMVLAVEGHRFVGVLLGCLGLATLLKLFPAAAAVVFLRKGPRGVWAFGGFLVALGLYLLTLRPYAEAILGSLDTNYSCAFGAATLANYLGHPEWGGFFLVGALVLGLLGAGGGLVLFLGEGGPVVQRGLGERTEVAGWVALPVYGLLFLSGVQYDYKVVFIYPALILALAMRRMGGAWLRRVALVWVVVLLLQVYWMLFVGESFLRSFLFKQGIAWMLYFFSAVLGGWLAGSLGYSFYQAWANDRRGRPWKNPSPDSAETR